MDEVCRRTNQQDERALRTWYCHWLSEAANHEVRVRNPQWTGSIAVGSKSFVHSIGNQMNGRNKLDVEETTSGWIIREANVSYIRFPTQKIASNDVFLTV